MKAKKLKEDILALEFGIWSRRLYQGRLKQREDMNNLAEENREIKNTVSKTLNMK